MIALNLLRFPIELGILIWGHTKMWSQNISHDCSTIKLAWDDCKLLILIPHAHIRVKFKS
jgi:hypothetical protein